MQTYEVSVDTHTKEHPTSYSPSQAVRRGEESDEQKSLYQCHKSAALNDELYQVIEQLSRPTNKASLRRECQLPGYINVLQNAGL